MSAITTDQVFELLSQSRAGRVTKENLQKFLLNPDGGTGYTVVVNFGKTVEEMVASGRYDWSNDNFTSKNFSVNGTDVAVALELVHLNKVISSEDVLRHLEENGMRPTTVEEFLSFGATYPEIQREFPVLCLGSSWVFPDGDRRVPCLLRGGSDRGLGLCWFGGGWLEDCRFLAVRKS